MIAPDSAAEQMAYYDATRKPAVALDVRMWRHSGIGTYLRSLTRALAELPDSPRMVCLGPEAHAKEASDNKGRWATATFDRPVYSLAEQIAPPRFRPEWALFHAPHYNFPLRWPANRPLVVTIHDLIHLQTPNPLKRAYARFFLNRLRDRAGENLRVLTVSEATREDLLDQIPGLEPFTRCIRNGTPQNFLDARLTPQDVENWRLAKGLPARFLLLVGIPHPRKNHHFVLENILPLHGTGQFLFPLVFCGVGDVGAAHLMQKAATLCPDPPVTCVPELSHDEMPLLYAAATALLFPSLEEGFGLPVLEAQAMGTPVLASDI
ncbi:glycosyltransferase, partial [bacterium]|nr:glycosyltransferase [bacterium]